MQYGSWKVRKIERIRQSGKRRSIVRSERERERRVRKTKGSGRE